MPNRDESAVWKPKVIMLEVESQSNRNIVTEEIGDKAMLTPCMSQRNLRRRAYKHKWKKNSNVKDEDIPEEVMLKKKNLCIKGTLWDILYIESMKR